MNGVFRVNLFKRIIIGLFLVLAVGMTVACNGETSTTTTESTIESTTESTTGSTTESTTETTTSTTNSTTFSTTQSTESQSTTEFVVGIEITEVSKTTYEFNEEFDIESLTVVYNINSNTQVTLSSSMISISGFDPSVSGEQTVTVTHGEYTDQLIVTVLPRPGIDITMEYYLSADGLTGDALFLELRDILNETKGYVSYDAARYILDESDADPTNPGNVILVYTGWSVSGTWDAGNTWNREHIWPQSLLGDDSIMTSDLHNLKPSNPNVNSSRGNKFYDNVTNSSSYEPRDEVKGDIARILLYMVTMYEELSLVNSTPSTYEMALLNVILGWHEMDPVDDFERNRNNVIAAHQGNRNPYIDYPEFVDLIWD